MYFLACAGGSSNCSGFRRECLEHDNDDIRQPTTTIILALLFVSFRFFVVPFSEGRDDVSKKKSKTN